MANRLTINYEKKPCYDIVFASDFGGLAEELHDFGIGKRRIAVIADSNTASLYGEEVIGLLEGNCKKAILYSFPAATYLRGVDFVQIPTTLLAQCDSSIGGKTGVDFDGYKNMVGAFYMPKLVYMNIGTLKTLDDRQFYAGFAEVMKHGLIKDALFYEWLLDNLYEIQDREQDVLEEMVMRSCTVKKRC